jgi:hypothetical protein
MYDKKAQNVAILRTYQRKSDASGSVATGRASSRAQQVKGQVPDKEDYPGPPGR